MGACIVANSSIDLVAFIMVIFVNVWLLISLVLCPYPKVGFVKGSISDNQIPRVNKTGVISHGPRGDSF